MPSPRIVWTDRSDQDVTDIWLHIARENAPAIADTMLARIYDALDILAFTSMIGRLRKEYRGAPGGFAVRPFTIIYEPLPERDGILVWRILHGARDLRRIVRPPSKDEL